MFKDEQFGQMKASAIFVNIARGKSPLYCLNAKLIKAAESFMPIRHIIIQNSC